MKTGDFQSPAACCRFLSFSSVLSNNSERIENEEGSEHGDDDTEEIIVSDELRPDWKIFNKNQGLYARNNNFLRLSAAAFT